MNEVEEIDVKLGRNSNPTSGEVDFTQVPPAPEDEPQVSCELRSSRAFFPYILYYDFAKFPQRTRMRF